MLMGMTCSPERRSRRSTSAGQTWTGKLSWRIVADTESIGESARLFGFAILEGVAAARLALGAAVEPLGVRGLEGALRQIHSNASTQRQWATRTGRREITARYGPQPEAPGGRWHLRASLADPTRARDVDWHLLNPVVGSVSALLPGALVASGLFGFLNLAAMLLTNVSQDYMGIWLDAYSFHGGQVVVAGLSSAQIMLAPPLARLLQRSHRHWVRLMLSNDTTGTLQERVRSLTSSRMTALDIQDAEIRRIERDLHDGAQARLVTIGMTVTQASRLLRHDADAALALLGEVKNDSTQALEELRSLVRGIRPPVLADRGLTDAVRAVAATNPIDTVVQSNLHGRLVGSLESAIFFAVSELMTNATKHSAASQIYIVLNHDAEALVVEVTDNGLGGAEGQELPEGGLTGVRHRLAPFDGTLDIVSPVGGGTFATIRVPIPID